jgi:hypothetical protein
MRTRLYAETDLAVLWLVRGRCELALSSDGIWLRQGSRRAELVWDEIEQVQVVHRAGDGPHQDRVEVFPVDGGCHVVGPFARRATVQWVRAAAAVTPSERELLPLDGAVGFALLPPVALREASVEAHREAPVEARREPFPVGGRRAG